ARAAGGSVFAEATVTVTALPPAPPGTGTGLRGRYYNNRNFTGLFMTRIDATVNFDWGTGSPAAGMGADTYSIRWEGEVQAVEAGSYVFRTLSDDGGRLWGNGQLVINYWADHGATHSTSPPVNLAAGQRVSIRLDYYENRGFSVITLEWQRPGQTGFVVVPQSQLYPPSGGASVFPASSAVLSGGAQVTADPDRSVL